MTDSWSNCYDDGWKDVITPESFAHPAKMAYGLLKRILAHAADEGWIKPGQVIVDPFGGIGSTGILGAYEGYQVISVELEQDFVTMAAKNYQFHCQKGWCTCGDDGRAYMQSLQETVSKKVGRRESQPEDRGEESVLFDEVQEFMGEGASSERETTKPTQGADTLEQGKAVVAGNEGEAVKTGKQRQSSNEKERAVEGGQIRSPGRLYSDKGQQQKTQNGTRSHNGATLGPGNDQGRSGASHKRESAGQPARKSKSNDNRRTSRIPQHRRAKPQEKTKTCPTCGKFIVPLPIHLCGDSRKLCEVVAGADLICSSPPFQEALTGGGIAKNGYHNEALRKGKFDLIGKRSYMPENQGRSPGQLSAMKPGNIDCILSSPPYAETLKGDGTQSETASESRAKRVTAGGSLGQSQRTQGYGSDGNLGNLKPGDVDMICSSPPFEDTVNREGEWNNSIDPQKNSYPQNRSKKYVESRQGLYGETEGQLGADKGDTFWQAAAEIVQQCHQILKPGGHAIWVVKSFVRKGKIVDFPGDWRRLCESVGLKTVCVHHAMLVKETRTDGLFGEIVEKKERKSFFRRLAEAKGSPKIDYEVVICGVKE